MPAKPYNKELFDPFIERVAGRTAGLVLGALKPEFLRPAPQPAAVVGHNNGLADNETSGAMTIPEFCKWARISRSTLYELWEAGTGPQHFHAGAARRISRQAAHEWLLEREREAAGAVGAKTVGALETTGG